ncbi:hypothetical protein GGX14DRAFT_609477 [Mycena pura]|uniref:DUF6534 domain-containing protein n=1 Tax=Mycena pura TaxID=153505 RepID=A0AAD6VND8_9AGAR|nr:hypothetical protein GGX14DRAFT_609477 [Mycena pura]
MSPRLAGGRLKEFLADVTLAPVWQWQYRDASFRPYFAPLACEGTLKILRQPNERQAALLRSPLPLPPPPVHARANVAIRNLVRVRVAASGTAPMLAGTQANWLLLGTLTLQVYKFHVCFPKERWWIKTLVYTLFTLEVVQTAVTSHFAYTLLVVRWGDPTVFVKLPWSSLAVPIFTGITSASVQIFFAWRIYTLKGEHLWARAVSVLIVMLALMQSLSALVTDGRFAVTTQVAELQKLMIGVKVWLIGSAVCDVVITLAMITILAQYRMKTPWKRTDSLITKLIYNTVETGAITSVVAVAEVILFILFSQTNLHQTPAFMLGKLYTNVLLTTLNTRAVMGTPSGLAGAQYSGDNTEMHWRRQASGARGDDAELALGGGTQSRKVHITTVTHVTTDISDKDTDKTTYDDNKVFGDAEL